MKVRLVALVYYIPVAGGVGGDVIMSFFKLVVFVVMMV